MKYTKLIILSLCLVFALVSQTFAQKIGHLNAGELLANFSEMKAANSQLEAFKAQKTKMIEGKAKQMETFYMETMQQMQEGKLSPIQQQQKESDLQKRQQELQKLEGSIQQEFAQKQSQLFQPIIDKVNDAIKRVGEKNGYDYIFDTSAGAMLHINKTDDVTSQVKQELGI